MDVTLINPPIVIQQGDFFSSGIPYVPVSLLYLTSYLREKRHKTTFIDAFGEAPQQMHHKNGRIIQGLTNEEVISRIPVDTNAIVVYAGLVSVHNVTLTLIQDIRQKFGAVPIIVIENTQSVVAYSLKRVAKEFFDAGATYIVCGEPEKRVEALLNAIQQKNKGLDNIDGLIYKEKNKIYENPKVSFIEHPDELPFPVYDLMNRKNYWKLGYSHAPLSSGKYLPILTSRGCTYHCAFCIVPETNNRKWRPRSPKNVVDEMEHWYTLFDVREFHVEDLNPTIDKSRIKDICNLILERHLPVIWKIAAGTKIEHIDLETAELMAKAGCTYLSFSPETGSAHVSSLMNKPFNHEFGIQLTKKLSELGVTSQACFVIGFPGETDDDRERTVQYLAQLAKAGLDEAALFIMTPIPGSRTYGSVNGYERLEQLTFTPTWRKDFCSMQDFRKKTYLLFFAVKLMYHPKKVFKQMIHTFGKRFETKTEMAVWRALRQYT